MLANVMEVDTGSLLNAVAAKVPQGYRFVTMSCTDLGDAHDILYHFDKDLTLANLRLKLPKGSELPSISGIYLAALVVENEIKDLFGINVTGLAIDFEGRFILAEGAPTCPQNRPAAAASDAKEGA